MDDLRDLKKTMRQRLGISERQLNRLIAAKEQEKLFPRDLATLALAAERNIAIRAYATAEDLAILRGTSPAPAAASPTASTVVASPARPRRFSASSATTTARPRRGRRVMVVHGRNEPLRKAMFAYLESLDLIPMDWNAGIKAAKLANPSVQEIVNALFDQATAVVVLLTPDDEARLLPEFHKPNDPTWETDLTPAARPNVLFEAGMAISSHPKQTVIVQVGHVRPFSDIIGSYITHMDGSINKRRELYIKLDNAGCAVVTDSDRWRKAGDFKLKEAKKSG